MSILLEMANRFLGEDEVLDNDEIYETAQLMSSFAKVIKKKADERRMVEVDRDVEMIEQAADS